MRERLVTERLRLANPASELHGVSAGDPAGKGFGARLDGLETGYGTELRPGLLAEIHGILDRLELAVAELKAVEAGKAAARVRLRRIGSNDSLLLDTELFCRDCRNRRLPAKPGAGCAISRTARCRNGVGGLSAPATGVRGSGGSWRWRASC